MISFTPASVNSSTIHWTEGLLCTGSIAFGMTFVRGKSRVPRPAMGMMARLIDEEFSVFNFQFSKEMGNHYKLKRIEK